MFVQILQTVMFSKWPNFCKLEYDAVAADDRRIFRFVLAERRQGFITKERVGRPPPPLVRRGHGQRSSSRPPGTRTNRTSEIIQTSTTSTTGRRAG